jgi:polar amino acid transport system substrate-binding protein
MQCAAAASPSRHRVRIAAFAAAFLAVALPFAEAALASAATLDRIKETARLTLGYRTDARPFSYRDESGAAAGYSVTLCQRVAEQVRNELGLSMLAVEWMPVTIDDRFGALQQGKIDLLCGADSVTLERRKEIAFSIPIFPSGIGALLRADAPAELRQVLAQGQAPSHPVWRASPARTILEKKTFSVVAHTTSENWLVERINAFQIDVTVAPVTSYEAGIQRLLDRDADVLFGDRPILLDAARRSSSAETLAVINRLFTYEPLALALARGDEDFRLVVDRTLSRLFGTSDFRELYTKWFRKPDEDAVTFFRQSALPE